MKTLKTKHLTFLYKEPKNTPATKTVFFFSLSAENSLTLPPFCHPVDTLIENGVRVISVTLPEHENNKRPYGIQDLWLKDKDTLKTFLHHLKAAIMEVTKHFPPPFGVMGISRGAFIALHVASAIKDITTIVGFAPLLRLKDDPFLSTLSLKQSLQEKKIHFFVGDNDTLIGTDTVTTFSKDLNQEAVKCGNNPDISVKISPSIGRGGHGTSDDIFTEGALWLTKKL